MLYVSPHFALFSLHSFSAPQSLGLLIGATVTNASVALTLAVLTVISCMLVAGFFVEHLPHWLGWAKIISFVTYGYDALLRLEFTEDSRFRCVQRTCFLGIHTWLKLSAGIHII